MRAPRARGARRGYSTRRPRPGRDPGRVLGATADVEGPQAVQRRLGRQRPLVLLGRDRLDQGGEPVHGALEVAAVEVGPRRVLERPQPKLGIAVRALGDGYQDLRCLDWVRPPGRAPELVADREPVSRRLRQRPLQIRRAATGAPAAVASRAAARS